MLVLPSVGATVKRIILNESATKAKIIYDDGSSTIVSTTNTPGHKTVKKVVKTPTSKTVVKKSVHIESASGMPMFKNIKTKHGSVCVPNIQSQQIMESKRLEVLSRAKKRAEMLGEKNMSPSERVGINAEEGSSIDI
jgi:hypothetical protein